MQVKLTKQFILDSLGIITIKFDLCLTIWNNRTQMWVIQSLEKPGEWLLFNANSAIVQLYHDENKLIVNEMMMKSA